MPFRRSVFAIIAVLLFSSVLFTTTSVAFHGSFFGVEESPADVTVTKSGPDSAAAGSDVTFTVTVTNLGTGDAAGVTLNDFIPAGLTFVSIDETNDPELFSCTTPSVGSGGTITCTAPSMSDGAVSSF